MYLNLVKYDEKTGLYDYQKFSLRRWFWRRVMYFSLCLSDWGTSLFCLSYERSGEDVLDALNMDVGEMKDEYLSQRGLDARNEARRLNQY